jgi:NAD(P)H-dependent flavin oxidoreductase YrpB (nitropropane dioxygenase family)
MPPRWNEHRLTAKLAIDYPIIQGPLGGLSSQNLTAAVSNFGGLGSFAAHGLTPGAIKDVIAEIRSLTSKPFAIPLQEILEECRAKHIVNIGTATTPEEGAALQDAGVDAIVASGFDAGGHRGSFLRAAEDSLTGTLSLVPQIADMVNVPVIAAGGIADARGVIAALALGAEAVQMGTVFLSCEESGASLLHRQALSDLLPLWAGQSANLSTCTDVLAFLTSLVEKVSEIGGPVIQWSAARREANS